MKVNGKGGRFARTSAYNAILAWDRTLAEGATGRLGRNTNITETKNKGRVSAAKDADLPAIKFKSAYVFYKHNQFVEAAKRYAEIVGRWPNSALSRKSARLVIESLAVQGKDAELNTYANAFRSNRRLIESDARLADELKRIRSH